MHICRILLIILTIGTAHANESKIFTYTPDYVTTAQAVNIISQAAKGRKWKVLDLGNKQLQLKLDHNDYKCDLLLTFNNQEITYVDSTTLMLEEGDDFDSDGTWIPGKAPAKWLQNLISDTHPLFTAYRKNPAKSGKIFIYTPELISTQDAIDMLKFVALNRHWKIMSDNIKYLKIKINHRGYDANLGFSFLGNEIGYDDITHIGSGDDTDPLNQPKLKQTKVPRNWLANLKNDMIKLFPYIQQLKMRADTTDAKSIKLNPSSTSKTNFFYKAPESASIQDSIDVLRFISSNREWIVSNYANDILGISLNHHDFKAKLNFSISGREIRYTDMTERYIDSENSEELEKTDVPANWLAHLQDDANKAFPLIQNIKSRIVSSSQKQ